MALVIMERGVTFTQGQNYTPLLMWASFKQGTKSFNTFSDVPPRNKGNVSDKKKKVVQELLGYRGGKGKRWQTCAINDQHLQCREDVAIQALQQESKTRAWQRVGGTVSSAKRCLALCSGHTKQPRSAEEWSLNTGTAARMFDSLTDNRVW